MMLALLCVALGAVTQQKVSPVEKVTALLEKLQAEVEEEGKSEAAAYDKYACFCKEQADNKQYAIEKFQEQERVLSGKIEAKEATKNQLDTEISQHNADISTNEAYKTRESLLSQAIGALENAIDALQASKGEMTDSAGGYTLLAKYSETIKNGLAVAESLKLSTGGAKLLKMLQQPDTAHAYAYHSNEIVMTLESLLKDFRQQKVKTDNEEREDRQAFEMTAGARRNQITALQKAASEKAEASAALQEEISQHQSDLTDTQNARAADQNFLNDLTDQCETKAKDYDQRSSTRAAELSAISKAIELLKTGVSKMYPSTGVAMVVKKSVVVRPAAPAAKKGGHWEWVTDAPKAQAAKDDTKEDTEEAAMDDDEDAPVNFLQVDRPHAAARKKLVEFLTSKSQALKSTVLSTLLIKLREANSPFQKVKQMIMDMITRLENEAADEGTQKAWCDTQMSETTAERDEAQMKIEDLNALLTEKNALVSQLTEQIATLGQEIADLQKALNEETELRNTEKATNEQTIADAAAGETAVAQALQFLKDFYSGAKESLLQQNPAPAAEGYERFSAEGAGSDGKTVDDMAPDAGGVSGNYGGKTDASKSIITLLEQIQEDFASSITA